jgi:hypothetical protein
MKKKEYVIIVSVSALVEQVVHLDEDISPSMFLNGEIATTISSHGLISLSHNTEQPGKTVGKVVGQTTVDSDSVFEIMHIRSSQM